jgi:ankyrin repeat protein
MSQQQQIIKLSIDKLDLMLKSIKESTVSESEILNQIIDDNRYIDISNKDGETVLHYACYMGYSNLCTTILSLISDISNTSIINKQDRWGYTPLHRACSRQFIAIAIILINKGNINTNYKNIIIYNYNIITIIINYNFHRCYIKY